MSEPLTDVPTAIATIVAAEYQIPVRYLLGQVPTISAEEEAAAQAYFAITEGSYEDWERDDQSTETINREEQA